MGVEQVIMCPETTKTADHSEFVSRSIRYDSAQMQQELTSLAGVLGRKWNLVIVNQLQQNGPLGFSDLLDDIEDISSKVLSESLDDLEESELVDRNIVSERPFRVEYVLTERATPLEAVIDSVRDGTLAVA